MMGGWSAASWFWGCTRTKTLLVVQWDVVWLLFTAVADIVPQDMQPNWTALQPARKCYLWGRLLQGRVRGPAAPPSPCLGGLPREYLARYTRRVYTVRCSFYCITWLLFVNMFHNDNTTSFEHFLVLHHCPCNYFPGTWPPLSLVRAGLQYHVLCGELEGVLRDSVVLLQERPFRAGLLEIWLGIPGTWMALPWRHHDWGEWVLNHATQATTVLRPPFSPSWLSL